MSKKLTSETLVGQFPGSVSSDAQKLALASAVAQELVRLYNDHNILAIYARIDELDGALLDILANDFHVDWWDANATLDEKRETFKNSWSIHRLKGTSIAVELFLSSVFKNATAHEWFDYGGEPFHYRLNLPADYDDKHVSKENLKRFFDLLKLVKNVRSRLDEFAIETTMDQSSLYYGVGPVMVTGCETIRIGTPPTNIDYETHQYIGSVMIDNGYENIQVSE